MQISFKISKVPRNLSYIRNVIEKITKFLKYLKNIRPY